VWSLRDIEPGTPLLHSHSTAPCVAPELRFVANQFYTTLQTTVNFYKLDLRLKHFLPEYSLSDYYEDLLSQCVARMKKLKIVGLESAACAHLNGLEALPIKQRDGRFVLPAEPARVEVKVSGRGISNTRCNVLMRNLEMVS